MNVKDYSELALRTEANQFSILFRMYHHDKQDQIMRLDNAARGLAGDAGEVSSAVMKIIEYGREPDWVNMLEEVGDCLWRLNQLCAAATELSGKPFTLELAMEANIRKLAERYPDGYSDYLATHRDIEAERKALEGSTAVPPVE